MEEFKALFGVSVYSFPPATRMGDVTRFLANRWKIFNRGKPLPALFRDEQQDSLL